MNTETFLSTFSHFARAPRGIKRLREIILHFAVSGRLVPYLDPTNGADVDIARAAELKSAYRERLGLRAVVIGEPLTESEKFFPIPPHWQWERLGNIACYVQRGKGPTYDAKGQTLVVSQKCVQWSGFDLAVARTISEASVSDYGDERFLQKGDLLWNSTGTGTAGRIVEFPGSKKRVVADSHVTVIRFTNFIPTYVRYFLSSTIIRARMETGVENSLVTGTTNQVELPTSRVAALPIPCPPVTEQTRIVHKVNELMMLCDKLETQQLERARLVPLLSQASHNCFAAAPTATNLDRIFDQVGNISPEDIHKTILTFAVRGLLVPQNSQDEPSTVSLERVSVDIRKWAVEHLDERYPVPNSWGWLQFGGVGEQRLGKMLDAQKNKGQLKPYLRNTNVQWLVFDLNDVKEMRIEKEEEAELRLRYGDLLVCEGGEPGRCAIWKDEVQEMYFQKALHRVRPCEALLPEYLALNLQIDCKNGVLASYFTGATIKHLTGRSLSLYSIPVPPLDEQRRIIAKVDQLMALVNTLDAHRRERDRLGEIFAQAVVTSLTHIQIQEAKGNMRAPKTQLVSNLKLGTKPKAKDNAPLAALLVEAKGEMSAKTLWQQSNLSIDDFYQQLRAELAHGWIAPPKPAEMKELIKPEPDQPILMRVTRRKAIRQLTD